MTLKETLEGARRWVVTHGDADDVRTLERAISTVNRDPPDPALPETLGRLLNEALWDGWVGAATLLGEVRAALDDPPKAPEEPAP